MLKLNRFSLFVLCLFFSATSFAQQSWVEAVALHGREVYMPADKYKWDWGQATFLNSLVHLYKASSASDGKTYVDYVQKAMEVSRPVANGKHPNAVASAHGIAFLARMTKTQDYLNWANTIYADYLKIPRAPNKGVSHRAETLELWDDTVYMLSMFLLEMYRLTGDDKYIADLWEQYDVHNRELLDVRTGLWVHGWDADTVFYDDGCSVKNWPDKKTQRNDQIWARGNGWVGMALADALEVLPASSPYRNKFKKALQHFVASVAPYQRIVSGHWYQLVTLPDLPRNFEESSATAMFSYAIVKGLQLGVLNKKKYEPMVDAAYKGLQQHSMRSAEGKYMIPTRVSGGTCVGDQEYYLNRKITEGTGFGYGTFIMFGLAYEQYRGLRK
jgi:unsaturated rhamnogalacturonyl hydrolase